MPKSHLWAAAFAFFLAFLVERQARGERELIVPFEERGHVVLDQLAGLRLDPTSGFSYAGPAGVAFRSTRSDAFVPGGPATETSTTTMWLAPSADVFVVDHLSVGGRIEIAHTWGAVSPATGSGQRLELPGTTTLTFVPRVGFYVPISDRIGIWPRAGFGWSSVESASFLSTGSAPVKETFRSLLLDVDVSVVYRFGETFFLRAGPEVAVTLGGRRTTEAGGQSAGASGSVLQITGTIGFGANIEL